MNTSVNDWKQQENDEMEESKESVIIGIDPGFSE